jgi:hypothetical protein
MKPILRDEFLIDSNQNIYIFVHSRINLDEIVLLVTMDTGRGAEHFKSGTLDFNILDLREKCFIE